MMMGAMTLTQLVLLGLTTIVRPVHSASYTVDTYKKNDASFSRNMYLAPSGHGSAPEFDESGHWFAKGWHAGKSNQEFLIDTGSADCLIGSSYYHKGHSGKYTGKNFTIVYYPDPKKNRVTGKVYQDKLSFAGLSVPKQKIGIFPSNGTKGQGGIIGWSGPKDSSFNSPSWFYNLCKNGALDQCRFGLAYGTEKTGKQVIGKLDHSLFSGSLTVAPRVKHTNQHWGVRGDVLVAGKVVDEDAFLLTDSGTDRIFAPLGKIRPIFDSLGYSYTYHAGNPTDPKGEPSYVRAVFPCDTTLDLAFRIPSTKTHATTHKDKPTISAPRSFKIGQSYFGKPLPDGNCTSILFGSNQFSQGFGFGKDGWLVGQAFFLGHYVDHNLGGDTMGFADLVNPKHP